MSAEDNFLVTQIAQRLRIISPNSLQRLAEEMAILACPDRFKGRPLIRQGRNNEGQTTKGWPDAYVLTSPGVVDGIEATRDGQSWSKHLDEDLKKARSDENFNLSGYFFVASYPDHEPSAAELKEWTEKFVSAGASAENVQLMIGKHLAMELARPKYAQIRQSILSLASSSVHFEDMRESMLLRRSKSLVQPTENEFSTGDVYKPSVAASVLAQLQNHGVSLVRGHGACGKTTLAYWIGLSEAYHSAPVYYLDLTSQAIDATIGSIKNELVELNGPSVLFIIDNIHIDENWAEVLLSHWKKHCQISGSHLLLLGRETGAKEGTKLGSVVPLVMRAGKEEFQQLVELRCGKEMHVSDSVLEDWLKTFGGRRGLSRGAGMIVVDLIAFGAALERRRNQIKAGDFRLAAGDAVAAVNERYLRHIVDAKVLENLLRLAVVSEFELQVPRFAFKYPAAGLGSDCFAMGLVLSHDDRFALAHAALGPLLLEASGKKDVQSERFEIARDFPYLGLGMIRAGMDPDERDALVVVLEDTLNSGAWILNCSSLHDLTGVALSAIRTLNFDRAKLDSVISSHKYVSKLIKNTRSLETLTSTAGRLKSARLISSANTILEPSTPQEIATLIESIISARNAEVLGFLKGLSNIKSKELLDQIDVGKWANFRSRVPIDQASTTCQLCRCLESLGHRDLAVSVALELISQFDIAHLFRSDLGDISNLVRISSPEFGVLEIFFRKLLEGGWLELAFAQTQSGQLCGALMSFANTVPFDLRQGMLIPAVTLRIAHESQKLSDLFLLTEEEYAYGSWCMVPQETRVPFDIAKNRSVARFICILGAGYALWGSSFPPVEWEWPQTVSVEDVYYSRSASDTESLNLGMYELQYWLGLKFFYDTKNFVPPLTDVKFISNFAQRLKMSSPPTESGSALQISLLEWLDNSTLSTGLFI